MMVMHISDIRTPLRMDRVNLDFKGIRCARSKTTDKTSSAAALFNMAVSTVLSIRHHPLGTPAEPCGSCGYHPSHSINRQNTASMLMIIIVYQISPAVTIITRYQRLKFCGAAPPAAHKRDGKQHGAGSGYGCDIALDV
jgi:hypothetical protein